jgi:flagellum-specific ATP synthase
MTAVAPREQLDAARRARHLLAKLGKARDLLQIGAYTAGSDAELDAGLRARPALNALLQQDMHERASLDDSRRQLLAAVAGT